MGRDTNSTSCTRLKVSALETDQVLRARWSLSYVNTTGGRAATDGLEEMQVIDYSALDVG